MVIPPIDIEYNETKQRWEFGCQLPNGMATATYINQHLLDTMSKHQLFYLLTRIGWEWRAEYDKAQEPKG